MSSKDAARRDLPAEGVEVGGSPRDGPLRRRLGPEPRGEIAGEDRDDEEEEEREHDLPVGDVEREARLGEEEVVGEEAERGSAKSDGHSPCRMATTSTADEEDERQALDRENPVDGEGDAAGDRDDAGRPGIGRGIALRRQTRRGDRLSAARLPPPARRWSPRSRPRADDLRGDATSRNSAAGKRRGRGRPTMMRLTFWRAREGEQFARHMAFGS